MMGFVALINHLFNFALPALWLASLLVLVQRVLVRRRPVTMGWRRQWMWLFGTGMAVLLAGLVLLQRDGAMLTYMALALAMSLMQWWLMRRQPVVAAAGPATQDIVVTVEPFRPRQD